MPSGRNGKQIQPDYDCIFNFFFHNDIIFTSFSEEATYGELMKYQQKNDNDGITFLSFHQSLARQIGIIGNLTK